MTCANGTLWNNYIFKMCQRNTWKQLYFQNVPTEHLETIILQSVPMEHLKKQKHIPWFHWWELLRTWLGLTKNDFQQISVYVEYFWLSFKFHLNSYKGIDFYQWLPSWLPVYVFQWNLHEIWFCWKSFTTPKSPSFFAFSAFALAFFWFFLGYFSFMMFPQKEIFQWLVLLGVLL